MLSTAYHLLRVQAMFRPGVPKHSRNSFLWYPDDLTNQGLIYRARLLLSLAVLVGFVVMGLAIGIMAALISP
jgi:hypothetical protein